MTSIDNKGSAHTDSIVEALLPNITDVTLDDLAATTFIDGGVAVPVTPADQLFMAAARRLGSVGGHGVLLLPRVRNRAALLLAITSHVLRLQPPTPFRGPGWPGSGSSACSTDDGWDSRMAIRSPFTALPAQGVWIRWSGP